MRTRTFVSTAITVAPRTRGPPERSPPPSRLGCAAGHDSPCTRAGRRAPRFPQGSRSAGARRLAPPRRRSRSLPSSRDARAAPGQDDLALARQPSLHGKTSVRLGGPRRKATGTRPRERRIDHLHGLRDDGPKGIGAHRPVLVHREPPQRTVGVVVADDDHGNAALRGARVDRARERRKLRRDERVVPALQAVHDVSAAQIGRLSLGVCSALAHPCRRGRSPA